GSVTINRGNAGDTITLAALPDFSAGLTIGAVASPFQGITVSGPLTLATDKSLVALASGTISLSATTSDIIASGTGSISLTTARDISLAPGSSIVVANGSLTL